MKTSFEWWVVLMAQARRHPGEPGRRQREAKEVQGIERLEPLFFKTLTGLQDVLCKEDLLCTLRQAALLHLRLCAQSEGSPALSAAKFLGCLPLELRQAVWKMMRSEQSQVEGIVYVPSPPEISHCADLGESLFFEALCDVVRARPESIAGQDFLMRYEGNLGVSEIAVLTGRSRQQVSLGIKSVESSLRRMVEAEMSRL